MTDALMQNMHAVHACNWDKFMSSLRAMLPSLMVYNNNQYGRWPPDFWAMLTSLPVDQVTLTSLSPLQVTLIQTWHGTCGLSVR